MGRAMSESQLKVAPVAPAQNLRLQVADVSATERQNTGQITGIAVVGTRILMAGQDARILGFFPLTQGPLRFVGPELRAAAPFVDMQAAQGDDQSKIIVVAACTDPQIRIWDVTTQQGDGKAQSRMLSGHSAPVRSVDLRQTFCLSAAEDSTARLWDMEANSEVVAVGHQRAVVQALFLPDSTQVATVCDDASTRIWDLRTSARPTCVIQELDRNEGLAIAVGDHGLLALADCCGRVCVYDIPRRGADRVSAWQLPGRVPAVQFALNCGYLACACIDGGLHVVRLADLSAQFFEIQGEQKRQMSMLRGAPWKNGRHLLTFAYKGCGWGFGLLDEGLGVLPSVGNLAAKRASIDESDRLGGEG